MAPTVGKSHHGPQGRARNRPCELGRALHHMQPTARSPAMLWPDKMVERGHALGGPGQNVPDDQMLPEYLIPHSDIMHVSGTESRGNYWVLYLSATVVSVDLPQGTGNAKPMAAPEKQAKRK